MVDWLERLSNGTVSRGFESKPRFTSDWTAVNGYPFSKAAKK